MKNIPFSATLVAILTGVWFFGDYSGILQNILFIYMFISYGSMNILTPIIWFEDVADRLRGDPDEDDYKDIFFPLVDESDAYYAVTNIMNITTTIMVYLAGHTTMGIWMGLTLLMFFIARERLDSTYIIIEPTEEKEEKHDNVG